MRIVCIMIDTLRYDYLGAAGDPRGLTPEIDKLASHSHFCARAYISSFPTVPNREDMFCGTYSFPFHGWGPLPEDAVPAAEILSDKGYITQLITDTPHLLGSGHGYHRGFLGYHWNRGNECDIYLTRCNHEFPQVMDREKTRLTSVLGNPLVNLHHWINADRVAEEETFVASTARLTSKWIEDNYKVKDFFLWVDTFECHEPWCPPSYYVERFDPGYKGQPAQYPNYHYADAYTKAELRNMEASYAGEVALTSKWVGHILRKLEDVGIYDDTLVIFTADHGTYLGERNRTGKFLMTRPDDEITPWPQYDEVNQMPLIVKLPGQTKAKRIKQVVQPVDVLPTILDLTKVKTRLDCHGHSMRPLFEGRGKWPRKYAYSTFSLRAKEPNFWTSINARDWCLNVGGYADDKPELFDLRRDRGMKRDVCKPNVKVANKIGTDYVKFLRSVGTDEDKIEVIESKFVG